MLVAPLLYKIAFYGGFVVGAVGLACVSIGGRATLATKQRAAENLPQAAIATRRPRSGVVWQLAGAFALLGGPAASTWLWFHSNDVVIVRNDERDRAAPTVLRERFVGPSAYQPPHPLEDSPPRRATWIVNESTFELTAQSIGYGESSTSSPKVIPPSASLPVESVDYVGPDDPPPGEITVEVAKDVADARIRSSALRVWLSWR